MNQIVILSIEDEVEVRDALLRDLEPFENHCRVEAAEDTEDARRVLAETKEAGDRAGLVLCDHLLPGETGVEFLVGLNEDREMARARKVLITGQAGMDDTIKAINEAGLDYFITKPWDPEQLQDVVRDQLTEYVLGDREHDVLPYVSILDSARLLDAVGQRRTDT